MLFIAFGWLLGLGGVSIDVLSAEDVLVVRSSSASPYRQAEVQVLATLNRTNHNCIQLDLKSAGHQAVVQSMRQVKMCIAIGTSAAKVLHANLEPEHVLVYCMVAQPDQIDIKPSNRVFEISINIPISTQMELIRSTLPHARQIGMLYDGRNTNSVRIFEAAKQAVPKGFTFRGEDVSKHRSVAAALHALIGHGIDVLWTAPDRAIFVNTSVVRAIVSGCLKRRKPVYGFSMEVVRYGGLIGLVLNARSQGTQSAEVAIKLLSVMDKVPNADLTAKVPNRVAPRPDIVINMQIVRYLNLRRIPPKIMDQARFKLGELK